VILIFYSVNGGPFGIEDIVRAGGPLYALLGFSLLLVWAVPEALITAELSTAFPEASGSVAWVEAAFGEFWAFQKGWLSWSSGVAGLCTCTYVVVGHVVSLLHV
jgi:amino acid transporter